MQKPANLARVALVLVTAVLSLGCQLDLGFASSVVGSGEKATESRELAAFDAIEVIGSTDVVFEVGAPSVTLEGDANVLPLIETRVEGSTLVIEPRRSYNSHRGVVARVRAEHLESVSIRGSGDVEAAGLEGGRFVVSVAGSGDVEAQGRVDAVEVSVSGSGDVTLRDLSATEAAVSVKGSGDVDVFATGRVEARVYGSGDVQVYGSPEDVERSVIGSGDIVVVR